MTIDLLSCLRAAKEYQAKRATAYHKFESGFKDFLATQDFAPYQTCCTECTSTFKMCSEKIQLLQHTCTTSGCLPLAKLLNTLQDKERAKLQLTIALHREQQQSFTHGDAAPATAETAGTGPTETEEEVASDYEGKISTLRHQLAAVVDDVNDVMDELQIEYEELAGAG
eukprot:NODE_1642_length_917_cov_153.580645_g1152_i0.p1 GENE.NODE_1642_length_917_cov_153.580645_g1152_i0~~NODE_1642_length_917_cov_153.580645_g1152_i0.p1  ORF type:complete len:169 (-),score=50.38 NODE_1642_length_917_cov_153.580645_g1152_i0:303-809(-)